MATLYRKYRPQNFKEIVGQKAIRTTLESQVQSDNFAHAYLFCGPRAVGKTTLARVFAKSINCLNRKKKNSEPCNNCESCQEITQGKSLDIIEIDAASHTGVDNVRENIIANSRVSPSNRKYKVFIIDEVHMLSISAFNALLKTLEEPPANVVFILCTTEVHKMPQTIISRCQRFDFKKISIKEIVTKLKYIIKEEEIRADKEVLEGIARHSEGYMRDAESILGQIVAIAGKNISAKEADLVIPRSDWKEIINLIEILAKKDSAGGIRLINKLVEEGVDLKAFTSDLIEILRKIMISKINPNLADKIGLELGENLEIKINEVSGELTLNRLVKFLNKFLTVRDAVKSSFIIQLPLELAVVELCSESEDFSSKKKNNPTTEGGTTIKAEEAPKKNKKNLTTGEVKSRWNEVLVKVKKYNHSLSFILKVCEPKEIEEGKLCLVFRYKFHKDRLDDSNIRNLVKKTLKEVFDHDFVLETALDENLEVTNGNPSPEKNSSRNKNDSEKDEEEKKAGEEEGEEGENDEVVDNILKTFGGKVIK